MGYKFSLAGLDTTTSLIINSRMGTLNLRTVADGPINGDHMWSGNVNLNTNPNKELIESILNNFMLLYN